MFCDRCGAKASESAKFCSNCGKALAAVPLMPAEGRIAGHVRLLGILWLALGAIRVMPGFALVAIFGTPFFPPGVPPFVHQMLPGIGIMFLVGAALSIVIGYGLLARQPWARMLAIVIGALGLVDIPFGTALGIYTLWVLLPAQSEREYRAMSGAA